MKSVMTLIGLAILTALLAGTALGDPPSTPPAQPPSSAQLAPATTDEPLYTQDGTDPTFAELLSSGRLKQGQKSTEGVTGSIIHVNKRLVDVGPNADQPIAENIHLHTLGNSAISRKDFSKWSRWYQEDGNVQVFRLFKGECNERNSRPLAARVETYSSLSWNQGPWHEWSGTYTIVKPGGASIFQLFNNKAVWILHLNMNGKGDVSVDHRPGHQVGPRSKLIATNMVGKPFFIRVRDNGLDYEVYLNSEKVDSGAFPRPIGSKTNFRWGMYKGESPVLNDTMYFVTGATFH
jgi:hypothetical protein